MMSPDLIAFLKAWYVWATTGAPDREPFSRGYGLCANADYYGGEALLLELEKVLGRAFPFGGADYTHRYHNRTQHECPKRLAWVRDRLIEAGELVA